MITVVYANGVLAYDGRVISNDTIICDDNDKLETSVNINRHLDGSRLYDI